MKLTREFYRKDTLSLAQELLGKLLVHKVGGKTLRGRIVETEAYLGLRDRAAHSFGGRKTPRNQVMYQEAGRAYIYMIYGLHYCFNITSEEEGIPEAVLIRGLEPLGDLDLLANNRYGLDYNKLTSYQKKNLTNGPGKLSQALKIDRSLNGLDLVGDQLYLEDDNFLDFKIVEAKRIGIDYSQEAKDYLYRFYIEGNKHVSRKK